MACHITWVPGCLSSPAGNGCASCFNSVMCSSLHNTILCGLSANHTYAQVSHWISFMFLCGSVSSIYSLEAWIRLQTPPLFIVPLLWLLPFLRESSLIHAQNIRQAWPRGRWHHFLWLRGRVASVLSAVWPIISGSQYAAEMIPQLPVL